MIQGDDEDVAPDRLAASTVDSRKRERLESGWRRGQCRWSTAVMRRSGSSRRVGRCAGDGRPSGAELAPGRRTGYGCGVVLVEDALEGRLQRGVDLGIDVEPSVVR